MILKIFFIFYFILYAVSALHKITYVYNPETNESNFKIETPETSLDEVTKFKLSFVEKIAQCTANQGAEFIQTLDNFLKQHKLDSITMKFKPKIVELDCGKDCANAQKSAGSITEKNIAEFSENATIEPPIMKIDQNDNKTAYAATVDSDSKDSSVITKGAIGIASVAGLAVAGAFLLRKAFTYSGNKSEGTIENATETEFQENVAPSSEAFQRDLYNPVDAKMFT